MSQTAIFSSLVIQNERAAPTNYLSDVTPLEEAVPVKIANMSLLPDLIKVAAFSTDIYWRETLFK